jgi:hypothetical protein
MPRFYIDVRSRFGMREDSEGVDLPDLEAARAKAFDLGRKIWESWNGAPPEVRRDITLRVLNERRKTLLAIPFSEIEEWVNPTLPEPHRDN